MEFNPAKHTKAFLLENFDILRRICKKSEAFAMDPLAQDIDILKLRGSNDISVAHILAEHQSSWMHSAAAKIISVLSLESKEGFTVAHFLAQNQPEWIFTALAKDHQILQLKTKHGWSVAHELASCQSEWVNSEAINNKNIMQLSSDNGSTVAHMVVCYQSQWINAQSEQLSNIEKPALFHKDFLTIQENGKLIAELISDRYSESNGLDIASMAILLITQGAAYKHSKPLPASIGETLLKQTEILIDDCFEPEIALRYAQAIYATMFHGVAKVEADSEQLDLDEWLKMLNKAETIIRGIVEKHPDVNDVENPVGSFCEPAYEFFHRLKAEIMFNDLKVFDCTDIASMAMRWISQGVAYKDSTPLPAAIGETLLKQTEILIDDCFEPEIALRYAQAIYSTMFHGVEKVKADSEQLDLDEWLKLLNKAETIIRGIVAKHPDVNDVENPVGSFCEPAYELFHRLKAEKKFKEIKTFDLTSMEDDRKSSIKSGLY